MRRSRRRARDSANRTFVGKDHISWGADALSDPRQGLVIDPLGTIEVDYAGVTDVRRSDVRGAGRIQFMPSRPVLAVISVLDEDDSIGFEVRD
ncbi:MAG: hypothetical protein ACLP50_09495 [Solirubrobacteraceae bacterium]